MMLKRTPLKLALAVNDPSINLFLENRYYAHFDNFYTLLSPGNCDPSVTCSAHHLATRAH